MEGAKGFTPEFNELINIPTWTSVVPENGRRTNQLIASDPRLGRLKPVNILEYLVPGSDKGIILFPGGLDHVTDDQALEFGQLNKASVFHVKYPEDSSFSIRREVCQTLDHVETSGIKKFNIVTGSWGGIPALKSIYTLLQEDGVEIESLFAVAAALQPSDLAPKIRDIGGRISQPMLASHIEFPYRQLLTRISRGVPDFHYDDPGILRKLAEIPTLLLVPPGGRDWWVDASKTYGKYLPNATKIEYPAYTNMFQKLMTIGGHDAKNAVTGIRQLEKEFILDPKADIQIPDGFKKSD